MTAWASDFSLDEAGNPDQNHRTEDCDQNAPNHAAAAEAQKTDDPPSNDAAHDPQQDVGNHAVPPAPHDFARCPASDQTNDDPPDNPVRRCHAILLKFLVKSPELNTTLVGLQNYRAQTYPQIEK